MELKGDRLTDRRGVTPFSVPKGYFDSLPLDIKNRVAKGEEPKVHIRYFHSLKHQIGISLGVLFFIGIAYSGYRYNKAMDDTMIQSDDYFEFVSNNAGEFNEQELIKVLKSGDKKVTTKKSLRRESDKLIEYLVNQQQVETAAVEALYKEQQNEFN
jgi:hypothetical protein